MKASLRRGNFLASFSITILLWVTLGVIAFFVSPQTQFIINLFFILLFIASLFTFALIFGNKVIGILSAFGITIFLALRYFGIGDLVNTLLLGGILLIAGYIIWPRTEY